MYRFRSLENLIGEFKELEKQEIYFASLSELNDPLERNIQFYWEGDEILWRNLFKHYVLCLENTVSYSRLIDENEKIPEKVISPFIYEENLPTEEYKKHIQEIFDDFFSKKVIKSILRFILSIPHKIYEDEILFYLFLISSTALDSIFKIDYQNGLLKDMSIYKNNDIKKFEKSIENLEKADIWNSKEEFSYKKLIKFINGFNSGFQYKLLIEKTVSPKFQTVFIDFPKIYLNNIKKLTYPDVYIACFMDNCLDSSIWGTYGNNHTGICLKFKSTSNIFKLKSLEESREYNFEKINYTTHSKQRNFFTSLGRLSGNQLVGQWFTYNSIKSNYYDNVFSIKEKWREEYWNFFHETLLIKLPSWSNEKESRIILYDNLSIYSEPQKRLFKYDFSDLESIIFGMKTPHEDKQKIIKIIQKKCKENSRDKLDFFEMKYDVEKQSIQPEKIFI